MPLWPPWPPVALFTPLFRLGVYRAFDSSSCTREPPAALQQPSSTPPAPLQHPSISPSIPRQSSASARHARSRRCHIALHTLLNFHRPASSVSTRIWFDTCGTSSCSAVNTTAVSRRLKARPYIPPALLGPRFNHNTAVKDHFNFR